MQGAGKRVSTRRVSASKTEDFPQPLPFSILKKIARKDEVQDGIQD